MNLLLCVQLAFAQAQPPAAPSAAATTAAPALALKGEEKVRVETVLATLSDTTGEPRRAALLELLAGEDTPAVKAALARALAVAYDDDAPHEEVRAAALGLKSPEQLRAEKEAARRAQAQAAAQAEIDAAERLAALREYKAQRLSIREETELRGGGVSSVYQPGYGVTAGTGVMQPVITDPYYTVQTWAVYEGDQRLSVPDYLLLTGQEELAEALLLDIQRSERQSKLLYGMGVAGVVLSGVGVIGQINSTDADSYALYRGAALGGVVLAVGGFVGGSLPASRARGLQEDVGYRFTVEQVQPRLDAYNEQLRRDLGLSAQDVLILESLP